MFIFNFSQLLIFRKSSQERIGKAHRPWINYYVFVRETLLDLGKKKKKSSTTLPLMKHFVGRHCVKMSLDMTRPSQHNTFEPASVPVMSLIPPKELSMRVAKRTSGPLTLYGKTQRQKC